MGATRTKLKGKQEAISVRNTSVNTGTDQWNWTIYIDTNAETLSSINCVEYTLHPSFPDPVRTTCEGANNFSLTSSGWGTFEVEVRVMFKDSTEEYLTYMLELG